MASDPSDPSLDDLDVPFRPKRSFAPWFIGVFVALSFLGIFYLYSHVEQRGVSIGGAGHIAVLPNGETWIFFLDGGAVKVAPESARLHDARSGPCEHIDGAMKEDVPLYEIDELRCSPGASIAPRVVERLRMLGLEFGYWPKELQATGQSLDEPALTVEIMAAMMDSRAEEPQLIPLYNALYPETLFAARKNHPPPPLIIQVARNDLVTNRLGRTEATAFLSQPRFMLAGAAVKGGWLVRTLEVVPTGAQWLEQLLITPDQDPWPKLLREPTLRVASQQAASGSPSEGHR